MRLNRFSCNFLIDFKYKGAKSMHMPIEKLQHSFLDFKSTCGFLHESR